MSLLFDKWKELSDVEKAQEEENYIIQQEIDIPKEPKRGLLFQYWKNENGEVFSRTPTDDILKLEVCGKKQNISTADRIKQLQVEIGCLEDEIWTLKLLQLEEAKANENNVETIIPQY